MKKSMEFQNTIGDNVRISFKFTTIFNTAKTYKVSSRGIYMTAGQP